MKMRAIFYAVFLVLLVSLSGIEGCPQKEGETGLGAYIGGTNGLDINFIPDEPPLEVLESDDIFYITLFVENTGEYTIPNGRIIASLSGINKDRFDIKSLNVKSLNEVFGRSKVGDEIIEGGVEELQFDQAEHKFDLPADFSTQIRVDVCYKYQTNALAKLCLKEFPIQRGQEDLCSVTNTNVDVENSGAPLQVRDVKSRASSDKVIFTFIIENQGTGDVYDPEAFSSECLGKSDEKNKVRVIVRSKSEDLNVQCGLFDNTNSGVVRLIGGTKTISCSVRTSGLQNIAFEEPFEIVLDYFYRDSVGKSLTVLNTEY